MPNNQQNKKKFKSKNEGSHSGVIAHCTCESFTASINELQKAFPSTLSGVFIAMQSRVLISIDVMPVKTIGIVNKLQKETSS